ncbi:MAG: PPC domain-containing protein, partial [Sulfurovum sp.]|nr:PPC domain-containing protein [Sulfurovum sp.]
KFPLAGFRNNTKNSIEVFKSASNGFLEDAFGYYMASDKFSNKMARTLSFDQDNTGKIETKSRSYGYSVRCIQKQKDEVVPSDDHGNLMDTATPIKLNNQTSGRINKAGDVDWFKIVISGTGILVVETTGTTDTEGFLYDAGGREIAFNDNISSSDNNFQISKFVTTGTYYVKVKHHTASSTGDYSLVSHLIADDYTNSRDDAGTISLASTTQGRINRAGDADWFKIVIPRTGTLVAKTVGLTDTKGSLYDASGTQIALDDNGGSGQNFKISKSITAAGTYYVKVKHSSVSSTGRYRLIIRFDDHSNLMDSATPMEPDGTTSGNLEVFRDEDWFKIVIPRAGALAVETTGTTDTKGYLYNASGVQLASNDNMSSSDRNFKISKFITAAGTYYVKVKHHSTTRTGSYALVSHFIPSDYGYDAYTATPIGLNNTKQGHIDFAGDVDYFKIIIPSGKRGTLIINTTGSTDTYGSLLGGSGAQLALDDNSGSGRNFKISKFITVAGVYYVRVKHHSSTGIGSYAFVSHFTPNNRPDTISTAIPINPNSTTQGNIEVANDKDFFKIHIPSRGTLVVETTGVTDTYGTLLDANGRQIAFNDNAGGLGQNFKISKLITAAGTYYVKVKHSSATRTGSYMLVSHFLPDDHANTRSTATPINPNSTTSGSIETAGDEDWFKIHIPSRGILAVETTGLTDTYGTLLDANGRQIAFNDNAGGDANGRQIVFNDNAGGLNQNFRISRNVKAGTYYVKVKHHSPTLTGNYSLVSHFVLDDYGDTRSTATPINPNSTTAGRLERDGDVDWFKIQISTSRRTLVVETTGSTDTIGELYDASGTQIATNNNGGTGNNFKISKFIMATGTYYVKVRHSGTTGTGSYALVSHFALDDHANSRSRATPINSNSTTAGRIDRAGDADWFKIQIPSRGALIVETTGTTDTKGYLYHENSTTPMSSDDNSGSAYNFRISRNVKAGTYYVKVKHHSPALTGGDYSLVSKFTPRQ